jgi:site-specific recombinase XerD
MLYRHGLRESELCRLELNNINLDESKIFIKRLKGGQDFLHPIRGDDLRLIRRYLRDRSKSKGSYLPWFFISEQRNSFCRDSINKLVSLCARKAKFDKRITPHMLRHGCGYALINKGTDVRIVQDYLGHRDIGNTVIYTKLNTKAFNGLWD